MASASVGNKDGLLVVLWCHRSIMNGVGYMVTVF